MSFTVNVSAAPPTVSITGNGQSNPNSITVIPGQTVTLVATFTPSGSYIGSAIDNFDSTIALTSQDASSPKTYDFNTPGNPGVVGQSYLFNANVETSALGWANSFGKPFTVNVVAACPANCNAAGSTFPPTCVPNNGNYIYNSGPNTCTLNSPTIITFSSNPTRVRKSTATSVPFSWKVTNPPATCTISGPNGFTPLTISPVDGVTGSQAGTVNISQASFFTLTCGAVTKQIIVGLIPSVKEI
jgi:hypothetical protein